ncbi:hypothetical protein EV142_104247 [Flavobacterium circumlabens]|uniref:Uncharacterized protein n=1 Tax=Flavobacterium circumlabens TaxID=2133765 RepID=A0ABY2AZH9_9FLAO|nr:hypothetical protein EV142_104247 [Flavobacterium circumlabens]
MPKDRMDNEMEYPWMKNTEITVSFFGKNSPVYREGAIINGWYESQIFKD